MSHITTDQMDRAHIKTMTPAEKSDLNADPISGEPGAHPVATGLGALSGVTAGLYVGMAAGPVGSLVGATIGAVVGGLAGHGLAESKYPVLEDSYWQQAYTTRPYYRSEYDYTRDYRAAYQLGYQAHLQHPDEVSFEAHESSLAEAWEVVKGDSRLSWADAKLVVHDGWDRLTLRSS